MADPAAKLRADRALRQAARGLVDADVAYIRQSVEQRSVPQRIGARLGDGARDIAGEAAILAKENRTAIGAGLAVGAVGLLGWLFRGQLLAGIDHLLNRTAEGEPEAVSEVIDDY